MIGSWGNNLDRPSFAVLLYKASFYKQAMHIYIGLDVGDKRVGVALSDLSGILASPFATFDRAQGRAEKAILSLYCEKSAKCLVVGLPLSEDGAKNQQCLKVENFCRRLSKRMDLKIYYIDEYASTIEAEDKLSNRGSKRGRGGVRPDLDAASAAVILQAFLDQNRVAE